MARSKKKILPKRTKTVKVLVPRSDNPRAQRTYLIVIAIMLWAATLRFLLILSVFLDLNQQKEPLDPIVTALDLSIFVGLAIGLYGILKTKPPLHYFIHYSAVVNLFLSYFAGGFGYLLGILSVLLLYIGLRFPIRFEWEKRRLSKETQFTNI
ncbi:MAG: hypothetical protein HeimC2_12680 [Candidatus Heimdallarchaeota archaeon LC_2]|nr:MAG: hypothetical protein HeimC2_12680 [Candidatus Heimdallarchaeota archaeon LC_2]